MTDGAEDVEEGWWVREQQLWYVCTVGGLIGLAVGSAGLLLGWALIAIGWAAQLNTVGITQVGVAVLVGLLLTNFVADRFKSYVFLIFLGLGRSARLVVVLDEIEPGDARTFCRQTNPVMLVGFAFFSALGIGYFRIARWTCATAFQSGGLLRAACTDFEPGLFRELLVFTARLQFAGLGVSGVLFFGSFLLQFRFAWRRSVLQRLYRRSRVYGWLHPMADFQQQLRESDEGE